MERLQELINRLSEQFDQKAEPSQMLQTTRLLDAELQRLAVQQTAGRVSAKVAVMMPSSMKIYTGQSAMQELKTQPEQYKDPVSERNGATEQRNGASDQRNGASERNGAPAPDQRNGNPEWKKEPIDPRYTPAEARSIPSTAPIAAATAPEAGFPVITEQRPSPADRATDRPPLVKPGQPLEVNDVIGSYTNGTSSHNDRLKTDVRELKSALNDTPVRDLKKAIGVNDRYVFINQLFRGDEVMYERSLKTINGFRILPEAEYWIERELKVKLAWDENREATRQFYHLTDR